MNIVDIIILVSIFVSGILGWKRGVFKQFVLSIGTLLVFYLAYKFKYPLGDFFLLNLPMFDFPNLFKGVITLNILVYQLLAFMIVLAILLIIFNIIIAITGIFEKLLRITVILGLPSKILGFLLGLVEGYVIVFVILFFLTQPAFSFDVFMESKLSDTILTSSPILTNVTSDTVELVQDIYKLKDETNIKVLNTTTLDMMLEKKVVKYDIMEQLYRKGKINFEGIESVLQKHKGA